MRRFFALTLGMVLFAALAVTQQTPQQPAPKPVIPDPPYKNLNVLPKDISKPQLVQTMKGFAMELGVRCSHCHVATDDLSSADFPSDKKPAKATARRMLAMTNAINRQYLEQRGSQPVAPVTCWTCHRDKAQPEEWQPPAPQ